MNVSPLNPMIEMTALFYGRPGAGASDEAVAEWYRAKGRMHEQLAARGGSDATQELAHAAASYEHARRIERRAAQGMAA